MRRKGCIYTYTGHTDAINCLRFSPDGKWIISAGEDGLIKVCQGGTIFIQLAVTSACMLVVVVNYLTLDLFALMRLCTRFKTNCADITEQ